MGEGRISVMPLSGIVDRTDWSDYWDDKKLVLKEVKEIGISLMHASDRLKDDRDVVVAAIQRNGLALHLASYRLRDDKDIVLSAVSQNGYALQNASEKLRDNEELVLAAVSKDAESFEYASERLRSDIPFTIQCAKINPKSMRQTIGAAKKLFEINNHDIEAVECYLKAIHNQNQKNEELINKLKEQNLSCSSTLFKRKILNV